MATHDHLINRRSVLGLAAAGSVSALASGVSRGDTAATTPINNLLSPDGMRMSADEAARVMRMLNIDALVLGDGRNFQYATGFRPVLSKMGLPPLNLAIVTAADPTRVTLVMAGFSYYYTAADGARFSDDDVFLYGASSDADSDAALEAIVLQNRGETALRTIEEERLTYTRQLIDRSSISMDIGEALLSALKKSNLIGKRIAYDSQGVANVLTEHSVDAKLVDADDALRRIRTIKSPVEIELMKQSSRVNVEAAHAALSRCGPGVSHKELRASYYSEVALRGGQGVFMVIDHVSDEQHDATLTDGQAFLIDCVCDTEGYLGDYGRTVFIGEPRKSARDAQRAVAHAWPRVREALKPGIKFSEIRALGQRVMRENGIRYRVPFNPHSVGMYHTDHFGNGSSPPREDIVLRPGMTLSVDCPILHSGYGGSVHLEDLVVITEQGSEPLHAIGDSVIQI
ncbi:MAG: M24 family metallopeptidase [Woeseiaceae bacterium]